MYVPYFSIIAKMTSHLEALGTVFGYFRSVQLPEGYRRELISKVTAETIHSSTAIEGNTLTAQLVADVLDGKPIYAQNIDVQEVLNYNEALSFVEEAMQTADFVLSQQIICEINHLLLRGIRDDIAGQYRIRQVFVGDYWPPEHYRVPGMMADFVAWLNQPTELSPILFAGIAHYQLVAIHPFEDGNGRTTRILTSLLLLRAGYPVTSLVALESYYNRNRQAYYQALSSADQYRVDGEPDLTRWLAYYVEGLLIEAERARSRLEEQLARTQNRRRKILLQAHQVRFLEQIAQKGSAQTADYIALASLSRRGAYSAIARLVKLGLVERSGAGRASFYTLTDAGMDYLR